MNLSLKSVEVTLSFIAGLADPDGEKIDNAIGNILMFEGRGDFGALQSYVLASIAAWSMDRETTGLQNELALTIDTLSSWQEDPNLAAIAMAAENADELDQEIRVSLRESLSRHSDGFVREIYESAAYRKFCAPYWLPVALWLTIPLPRTQARREAFLSRRPRQITRNHEPLEARLRERRSARNLLWRLSEEQQIDEWSGRAMAAILGWSAVRDPRAPDVREVVQLFDFMIQRGYDVGELASQVGREAGPGHTRRDA